MYNGDYKDNMKNKMLYFIILAAAMVLSLSSCDANSSSGSSDSTPTNGLQASEIPDSSNSSNLFAPDSGEGTGADTDTNTNPDGDINTSTDNENSNVSDSENNSSQTPSPNETSNVENSEPSIDGSPIDVLESIIAEIRSANIWMPMSMPSAAAPIDERRNAIGLDESDYAQYVVADAQSMAGITTQAHQIIVYQCIDESAALQVKTLLHSADGYNPQKWICVYPEKVMVVEAASYILLVASYSDVADAALSAFREIIGSTGEAVTFWEYAVE